MCRGWQAEDVLCRDLSSLSDPVLHYPITSDVLPYTPSTPSCKTSVPLAHSDSEYRESPLSARTRAHR